MAKTKQLYWSATSTISAAVIDILRLAVLSRFLEASEFGLLAIAMVLVGFSQLLSEGGLGNALVSQLKISSSMTSSLVNLSFLLGSLLYVVVLLISPFIAEYYQLEELFYVFAVLGLTVPLSAINRIGQASLQRELSLEIFAIANVTNKITVLLSTILFIFLDLRLEAITWPLIFGLIVSNFLTFRGVFRQQPYSFKIVKADVKKVMSFSLYQLVEMLLTFFSKNFDVIIFTKLLGADVTGFYSLCKNTLMRIGDLVITTFNQFYHPLLSKIQEQFELLSDGFLAYFRSASFFSVLGFGFVYLNADWISPLLFSQQSNQIIPMLGVFCVWLTIRYMVSPIATLWLVRQKPHIGVIWNLVVSIVFSLWLVWSAEAGLQGVLEGFALLQFIFFIGALILANFLLKFSKGFVLKVLIWSLFIGFIAIGTVLLKMLWPVVTINLIICQLFAFLIVIVFIKKLQRWFIPVSINTLP